MPDLNCTKIEAAMAIVEGTAKNMGIKVEAAAMSMLFILSPHGDAAISQI